MADVPWNRFIELRGDARRNFELLCRELVRRHYEGRGPLLTRKQQPGVEFHLRVEHADGALGDPGRHWGWQCRWYEADAFRADGRRLLAGQRKKIEEAIAKSAEHVPGLTDWVLWTREKLGADDERWFNSLETPFTLHRWDEETMAALLAGPAAILRETWFGDLVLDRDTLVRQRRLALAPIEHRYEAELHVRTPPERSLGRVLLAAGLPRDIGARKAQLEHAAQTLAGRTNDELTRRTAVALDEAASRLAEILALFEDSRLPSPTEMRAAAGDPDELEALSDEIRQRTEEDDDRGTALGGAGRILDALHSTLMSTADNLELGLVVLAGAAGAGKTHLAAHLSGPDDDPAGVLVLGRQFDERIVDDDVARLADLGNSTPRLLEALEALGLREGRRVPLVIDGINESVEPAAWKDALARLRTRLAEFRHVVGIVTLRPKYVDLALPKGSKGFKLDGLAGVEAVAVHRYFAHYKIKANQEAIDWWRPSDPLLLSIFCRTVNADRRETVEAAELPQSLSEVFEAYLADLGGRIGTTMTIDPDVVSSALAALGRTFFEAGTRELDVVAVAEALGDPARHGWKDSMRFQLEAEEVLVRDVFEGREKALFGYDLLAGHVIATDLLARFSPAEIAVDPVAATTAAHPLGEDIVTGLTGLLGAAGHEPTVALGEEWPLAAQVALASVRLPDEQLGPASVAAIRLAFAGRPIEVLGAIAPVALRAGHPLNATVLDSLLDDLEAWQCDLIWSEWIRERSETIMAEVVRLEHEFAAGDESADPTAALTWLSWLLTTTDKPLRDAATKALYRLGHCHPELLFARTLDRLDTRDQAIPVGLMAAAYGVAMASQEPGAPAREAVFAFATELQARLLGPGASEPTWHWLIREYAYRTTQLAAWISDGEFEAPSAAGQPPLPAPASGMRFFRPKSKNWRSVDGAFGMDFANYTIGRLVEGRSNYDEEHPRFVRISGEIRARVADLGWSEERFAEIDRAIARESYDRSNNPDKVERYGKKYSWAAFYEAAGRISDRGELQGDDPGLAGWRISDIGLDPSFPETIATAPPELPEWVPEDGSDEQWARSGMVELPDRLLRVQNSDGTWWVVVDGYVGREPPGSKRKVFCFIRGLLALEAWTSIEGYLVDHAVEPELVPGNAGEYYCFAGEAPWSATFDSWATAADGTTGPEERRLGWRDEDGPLVELLAVDFNWESYHSVLNDAEIGSLPSKAFARFASLTKLPDRAEFVDLDGELAARTTALKEEGWRGRLLLAREDVLAAYCRERGGEWGWVVWGEREVRIPELASFADVPDWMREVKLQDLDRFSRVASLAELQVD